MGVVDDWVSGYAMWWGKDAPVYEWRRLRWWQ